MSEKSNAPMGEAGQMLTAAALGAQTVTGIALAVGAAGAGVAVGAAATVMGVTLGLIGHAVANSGFGLSDGDAGAS